MQVDMTTFVNALILHLFLQKWMSGDTGIHVVIAINPLKIHIGTIVKII